MKNSRRISVIIAIVFAVISVMFLLGFREAKADTTVSGIISSNTTWNLSGSPYNITSGNVQIASDVTLTIEPGVIVNGYGNKIETWGNLNAIGNSGSNITLNNVIVEVENNASSGLINIQFAKINYGTPYKGEQMDGGLTLTDSVIKNASKIDLWYPAIDCHIERNVFINSDELYTGAMFYGGRGGIINIKNNLFYKQNNYAVSNYADYGPGVIVEKNSFLTTSKTALILLPTYGEAKMTAINNYWNTTDANTINSMIYDKNDDLSCADYLGYTPFLTEADLNTPSLPADADDNPNDQNNQASGNQNDQVSDDASGSQDDQSSDDQVSTDTSTLSYNASKKAKKRINLTFNDLTLTKKKWVKVRLNGRKVTTVRVRRSGNNSIVAISFKYKKWAVGNYNLSMTYKNQIKVPYTTKKGKTKYRKGWESGSVNSENILSII